MAYEIERSAYAAMFGPTAGDKLRLADTDLFIEVEEDRTGEPQHRADHDGDCDLRPHRHDTSIPASRPAIGISFERARAAPITAAD